MFPWELYMMLSRSPRKPAIMASSSSSHIPEGCRRVAVDVDEELADDLDNVLDWLGEHTPYRPTKVAVVSRGIELALDELREQHGIEEV